MPREIRLIPTLSSTIPCGKQFISTLLSWGISVLEARWPHRLEACATGNLTK